jgi:hypothetical protein
MEDFGNFYVHLINFTAISYILWPFGSFCGHFGTFYSFWYFVPRKIWQLCSGSQNVDLRYVNRPKTNHFKFTKTEYIFSQKRKVCFTYRCVRYNYFSIKQLPPYTLSVLDLTTHISSLLGDRRRRCIDHAYNGQNRPNLSVTKRLCKYKVKM